MSYSIGCDSHKRYSIFAVMNKQGKLLLQQRINHEDYGFPRSVSGRHTPRSRKHRQMVLDCLRCAASLRYEAADCKLYMAHTLPQTCRSLLISRSTRDICLMTTGHLFTYALRIQEPEEEHAVEDSAVSFHINDQIVEGWACR